MENLYGGFFCDGSYMSERSIQIGGIGVGLRLGIQLFLNIPLCFPTQVHGVANDTIKFVQNIINTEINSATDNPVSFPEKTRLLLESRFCLCTQIVNSTTNSRFCHRLYAGFYSK